IYSKDKAKKREDNTKLKADPALAEARKVNIGPEWLPMATDAFRKDVLNYLNRPGALKYATGSDREKFPVDVFWIGVGPNVGLDAETPVQFGDLFRILQINKSKCCGCSSPVGLGAICERKEIIKRLTQANRAHMHTIRLLCDPCRNLWIAIAVVASDTK